MQYLEISGKEYPVHFGTLALKQFCIKHNIPKIGGLLKKLTDSIPRRDDGTAIDREEEAMQASSFDFQFSLEELIDILRFGINDGYRKLGQKEASISEEEAADLFDEHPGLATPLLEAFTKSIVSLFQPEEGKKAKAKPQKAASKN